MVHGAWCMYAIIKDGYMHNYTLVLYYIGRVGAKKGNGRSDSEREKEGERGKEGGNGGREPQKGKEGEREGGGGGVVNKTQGNRGIPLYKQKSNTNELQELKMEAGFPSKQATYIQPNAIMSVPLSCSR